MSRLTINVIHSVLWHLIIFAITSGTFIDDTHGYLNTTEYIRHKRQAQPPLELKINILSDNGMINLNLKRTNQRLASAFVPVYFAYLQGNEINYVLQDGVMNSK